MTSSGWIGVDLDGTLAHYTTYKGDTHIGDPIPKMQTRVKQWLKEGKDVRIFTARANTKNKNTSEVNICIKTIQNWCEKHLGKKLPITCEKDLNMIQLWDDRCVQVITNTGMRVDQIKQTVPKK